MKELTSSPAELNEPLAGVEHIAIIMDGNGRWAKKRLMPRNVGHKKGAENLRKLIKDADSLGLKYLSVYAFSTENWKRDKEEVESIMGLFRKYLTEYFTGNENKNIRVKLIGNLEALPKDIFQKGKEVEKETANYTGLTLIIAINYGGRDEIVRAAKKMLINLQKTNTLIENITEAAFEKYLDTYTIPHPEIVIRTSGELRISNFLLWQAAYSEFYFTNTLWPDFTIEDIKKAIEEYSSRERRFGK
ncbi:MAG: isoprenyl transferase [Defluviitaleaceae bacterium]|nr:isoprenyl transferase [Defluviitaleaceae bacterium]